MQHKTILIDYQQMCGSSPSRRESSNSALSDKERTIQFHLSGALDRLNDPESNGSSLFEGLSTTATISLATHGDPPSRPRLFNYAIARVRYRARTTTAARVKCFFRMFNVAATGLEFNPGTGYRSAAPNSAPKIGLAGGKIASIPFFASDRVETVQGRPGATSMDDQILDDT